MKKHRAKNVAERDPDELLPEYDFSNSRPNPYAEDYTRDMIAVVLEPDVAKAFPTAASVDKALRLVAKLPPRKPKKRRGR